MKITLLFGKESMPESTYTQVIYDSSNPDSDKYIHHQVTQNPLFLVPGSLINSGTVVYRVVAVEGPLFEKERVYYTVNKRDERDHRLSVRIMWCDTWTNPDEPTYGYKWGNGKTYELNERELLALLTE